MKALRPSVRIWVLLTIALSLLCFLPLRTYGGETARSIGSLTPDQRNHLPDDTKVTLAKGRTVTLGTLRAEHKARLERFSRAALWGKRVAERMPKPSVVSSSQSSVGVQRAGITQNSVVLAPQPTPPGRSGQQQQKQGGGGFSKSNASVASGPSRGLSNSAAKAASNVLSTLIPLQTYSGPIPADYLAFCRAAMASACIYLPPNTTFTTEYTNSPPGNGMVGDVDPLITDPAACASFGGSLDGMQQCVFKYFSVQRTNFKYPGGKASAAEYCDLATTGYGLDAESGTVWADTNQFVPFTTGAAPITCVVQLFFNQ